MYPLDFTSQIGQGGSTSAEQHPWPISTVTVDDFSGRPNFCSRGTRFGVHSMAENFQDPSYGRLLTSAWSTPAYALPTSVIRTIRGKWRIHRAGQ